MGPAPPPSGWGRRHPGLAGAAAALVALGAAELVAGLDARAPSFVVAVGQTVIDLAPPAAKDVAIALLGTADKPALVVLIVVLILLLGTQVGRLARRRFWWGAAAYALGGLALAWNGLARTSGATLALTAAGLAAAATGAATLRLLLAPPPAPAGAGGSWDGSVAPAGRRQALRLVAQLAGVGVVAGGLGRFLARFGREDIPDVTLPPPAAGPGAPASATSFGDVRGLSPLFTPNDSFYRIDTALVLPRVDLGSWRLRVTGMVDRPFTLTYDELLALARTEVDVTLSCVSNEVGGDLVGTARWQGVPLGELLDRAGVQPGATQVVGRSVDGWTGGFPTADGLDGRPALVAVGMNGAPLPLAHGFPARLVVAGLYGYVSATKWLSEIELTTLEGFDGYWVPRGWSKLAPVKLQSRIDVPRHNAVLAPGRVTVAGIAWSPPAGVGGVEVSVDGGPWQAATLAGELSPHVWRQWRYAWEAAPGRHVLRVRAADGAGRRQVEARSQPRPDGATGLHEVQIFVREG